MTGEDGPEAPLPPFTWETPQSTQRTASTSGETMSASAIIDRSMSIYRRGFLLLLAVAALIQVPLAVVQALIGQRLAHLLAPFVDLARQEGVTGQQLADKFAEILPAFGGAIVVMVVVSAAAGLLMTPALIHTAARLHAGELPSVGEAYRVALRSAVPLFFAGLVQFLAILAAVIAFGVASAVLLSISDAAAVLVFFGVIGLVIGIGYALVRWTVWSQAIVIERRGPIDALRRSWRLVNGSMWRTAGLLAVLGIAGWLAGLVFSAIAGLVSGPLPAGSQDLVSALLAVLTVSWGPILLTVLFVDLLARRGPSAAVGSSSLGPTPALAGPIDMPPPQG